MGLGLGAAIGIGGSVLGGIVGRSDAKKAQAYQERLLQLGLGKYEEGRLAGQAGYGRAEPFMDELLGAASSLEDDLLAQVDPITAREVRRINQEREYSQGIVNQQMASRGLDSFTTRMGAQSNAQGQASNAMSELAARMAGVRSSAITQGRGAYMQALGARGNFEVARGGANAEGYYRQGALYGNTQVIPPQTASGIGQLAGGLASMYQTSVLEGALNQAGPGGGGLPKEVWE